MKNKYKKSYKFAFKSSAIISLFAVSLSSVLQMYFFEIDILFTFLFAGILFAFSFLVLQYRVENFIYKRIQKIYKSVSLLDESVLRNRLITTDMQTLMEEVNKVAKAKKIEIEALKIREEYRREFIGNVAHELKTPLFTVQGYLATLIDGKIKDKDIRKKYLKRAEHGVERLIDIVNDLDMITKLESSELQLNLSTFDVVALIQEVFEMLEMKADKRDIVLMFDKDHYRPIYVKADREKIRQVFVNLLDNSIKYGKENGTTEVAIETLTSNKILIRIYDNGPGIEERHLKRLFERFYRIDSHRSREIGGSGLGLAIVKHIIEAHNDHIYVDSTVGKGSEFAFTIEKSSYIGTN